MNNRKNILIGLAVFLSYFVYSSFQILPLSLMGLDYNNMSLTSKVVYLLLYELIYILILILIYNKTFVSNFKDFFKNFKDYIKKYMEYWALAFGLMIVSNFVITSILPDAVATNQENINSILGVAPFYMIVSAVIYAPFLEETIFRLSIRKFVSNDKLFIFLSGIIFGALHVISSFNSIIDLIYIIPYSIPGFVFAYTLVKSKNIFVPMSLHFFHNGFTILMQLILSMLV